MQTLAQRHAYVQSQKKRGNDSACSPAAPKYCFSSLFPAGELSNCSLEAALGAAVACFQLWEASVPATLLAGELMTAAGAEAGKRPRPLLPAGPCTCLCRFLSMLYRQALGFKSRGRPAIWVQGCWVNLAIHVFKSAGGATIQGT